MTGDEDDERSGDGGRDPLPPRLLVVAYGLALTCALAPFALIGVVYAVAVLAGRGQRAHAAAVLLLGLAGATAFVLAVR